jgi:hypothetical protein
MMLMTRHHRALLIRMQVGGCTCETKTNEIKYHATDCQYRLACEIEEALTFEDDRSAPHPPTGDAAGKDSVDAARPEWADCESRGPMMRNSLQHRITKLKSAAKKCRVAYRQDYMRAPFEWLADAYDEAAETMERRLAAIASLTKTADGENDAAN